MSLDGKVFGVNCKKNQILTLNMFINKNIGYLQDWITQVWVKVTGRTFDPVVDSWLVSPIGDTELIRKRYVEELVKEHDLEIRENEPGVGLLDSFDAFELTEDEKKRLNPKIADFYERTSTYNFEVWSEWNGIFKPFGWLLSIIFSKRLQQLNLPLSPLAAARGIESNIIKLVDRETRRVKWTVWYRVLKSNRHVVFSGIYGTCDIPSYSGKFLKVVFPLPNGNATVVMRREILPDGSLKLHSDGRKFGGNGFYFTLTNREGKYWARFVRSMHEWITVYVDEEGVLRTDHNLHFYGFPFLHLHYKMVPKSL